MALCKGKRQLKVLLAVMFSSLSRTHAAASFEETWSAGHRRRSGEQERLRLVAADLRAGQEKLGISSVHDFSMASPETISGLALSCSICHFVRTSLEASPRQIMTVKSLLKKTRERCNERVPSMSEDFGMHLSLQTVKAGCYAIGDSLVRHMHQATATGKDTLTFCVDTGACLPELDVGIRQKLETNRYQPSETAIDMIAEAEAKIEQEGRNRGLAGRALENFKRGMMETDTFKRLRSVSSKLDSSYQGEPFSAEDVVRMTKESINLEKMTAEYSKVEKQQAMGRDHQRTPPVAKKSLKKRKKQGKVNKENKNARMNSPIMNHLEKLASMDASKEL